MNQLVCRTNKQLTRSMIDGTKVACLAHPLNARISVRWFHQRYHDRMKPVNMRRRVTTDGSHKSVRASNGMAPTDERHEVSIGIEDAN